MRHTEPDIDKLISLYLSQRASAEQRQELERWILASEDNRASFYRLEKRWAMSFPANYDPRTDIVRDKIWESAVEGGASKPNRVLDSKPRLPWLRIAAVFMLFLLGAWLFTILDKTEEPVAPKVVVW